MRDFAVAPDKVDGKQVATQKMERWDETFDVGADTGTPVDDRDCQVPFDFAGKLVELTIELDPPVLTPTALKLLQEKAQRDNSSSE